MGHPKLLDTVALLQALSPETLHLTDERYDLSTGLEVGAVGTVVEAYPRDAVPSACLVEFSDAHGAGMPSPPSPSTPCSSCTTSPLKL